MTPEANAPTIDEEFPISGDPSKYVTLPVQNQKIWRLYQETLDTFWTAAEIYVASDKENMPTNFSEQQTSYIMNMLAIMFTSHYTTITKELFMDLMGQVDIKEASYFFGSQADAKKTHCLMYSKLLDELTETGQKGRLVSKNLTRPQVRDFIKWSIESTTSSSKSFAQRLLAFACLQGVIYPVPFTLFKWLQKQHPKAMPGLYESNDLISRDERLNLRFSCSLFEYLDMKEDEAHEVIAEAVKHAKAIFGQALPATQIGIEIDLLHQFIEHSADSILNAINMNKLYNSENCPFDWVVESAPETNKADTSVVDLSTSFVQPSFDIDNEF